ncbi:hypothetical protein ACIOEX_21240 [Streptomyces sp. NPDC087850]|uniref:hypothetical protein n=1 Tax=Streptomyces sp. NPDC087850 TaxID=3365809 RepID=UPI0038178F10
MKSSSPGTETHTTGAHRALRRAPHTEAQVPPARYEPYLDGLFTYCLSVLCDHGAATGALGDVLAISERQYGRCPSGAGERRAWLYAIARWTCLRRLAERRRGRQGAHSAGREPDPVPAPEAEPATAERHRTELARLAWPEAAGTTPEQREVLELAVRHRLGPRDVAAVLSMDPAAARELLASAACEVERTRAALAVVDSGDCPAVARLTGDHQVLLSVALRRELVRHVDDCPRCRRAAERAEARGPWPGSRPPVTPDGAAPAALPLVTADRSAAYTAMTRASRARTAAPRFGRNGFPLDPKDRAARRDRLRARAVTTTVVATVVAAPVLALWAAYRHAPQTGEGHAGSSSVTAGGNEEPRGPDGPHDQYEYYENAGSTQHSRPPELSVEVISDPVGVPPTGPGNPDPGRLTVEARPAGDATLITLRASGGEPVSWTAGTEAPWLRLGARYGTLAPGESRTLRAVVDHAREPSGPWSARIAVYPAGAVVRIRGYGARPAPPHRPPYRPAEAPARPPVTTPAPPVAAVASPAPPPVTAPPPSPGTPEPSAPAASESPGPEPSGQVTPFPEDPPPPQPD